MSRIEFPWIKDKSATSTVDDTYMEPKLGKICDWTVISTDHHADKYEKSRRLKGQPSNMASGLAGAFSYTAAEDEASFSTVDRASAAKKQTASKKNVKPAFKKESSSSMDARSGKVGSLNNAQKRRPYMDRNLKLRDSSVTIGQDWSLLEEVDHSRLMKLSSNFVSEAKDLSFHGSCGYYDKSCDKITSRFEKTLQVANKPYFHVTTSEDPVIQKIAEGSKSTSIFSTDIILSTLMCATRSQYPWDIVVTKNGNKIFLDKRDGSSLDLVTVNENAAEPPLESTEKDAINTPLLLSQEASLINQNFLHQIIRPTETVEVMESAPFNETGSAIYRYRQWDLEGDVSLIVRTEINAAMEHTNGTTQELPIKSSSHSMDHSLLVNIHALNEFDSKALGSGSAPDWRQKIDAQRGAVLATEIKNNGNKLSKWTIQAILAGADLMKIGYVSRVSPKDRFRHVILGTSTFKPQDFASQMNLDLNSGWGIVKAFSEVFSKLGDGKYILVRDANKPILRLYGVPENAFDETEVAEKDNIDE